MLNENKVDVSIVIPVCNEEGNINKIYAEILERMDKVQELEFVFVDDGSTDQSWKIIKSLSNNDKRIRGIRFSRNFGHQYALYAGLVNSRGDAVITMDADLQHPPSVIPKLLEEWHKGSNIVNTFRIDQKNISFVKKNTSWLFYKVFSFLSGVEMGPGTSEFRLLDRQVVNELLKFNESGIFLRGLVHWVGFSNATIPYQCQDRYSGQTKYSFFKMCKFAWRGITSFSIVPLRIGIIIGILTSMFAFFQLLDILYLKLFTQRTVPGWSSTVGLISLMFGILFILLGVLGEYIGRILFEVRGRPRYIVSDEL